MTVTVNMSKRVTATVYLLRHGEPIGGPRYRGSRDDALSDLGWQQMHNAVEPLHNMTSIISSPLLRCYDFSKQLSYSLNIPVGTQNALAEIHFGDWEGKTATELWQHDRINYENYLQDPLMYTPPNGETLTLFSQRVLSTWENLVTQLVTKTQGQNNMLLVAHGGTVRVILQHILGMPLQSIMKIHVPFASVSKILIDYDDKHKPQCRLAKHNLMPLDRG